MCFFLNIYFIFVIIIFRIVDGRMAERRRGQLQGEKLCGENGHVSKEQLVDKHLSQPGSPQFTQQNGKMSNGRSQLHGQNTSPLHHQMNGFHHQLGGGRLSAKEDENGFPQLNNDQLFKTKDQLFKTKDQQQQEMHHTCELCGSEGFNEDDLR